MELAQIERRSGLTRKEFLDEYYKPKRPVVITDLAHSWPATQKWTFENLIRQYGHLEVPVIGPDFHKPGPNYMKSQKKMKFGDYLQMIQAGPTDYRIFFWNIFDHAAEMANDFSAPKHLCGGFFNTTLEGGYSLTLRSYDNPFTVARGFTNVVRHYVVDKTLNNIWGAGWKDWKEEQAQKNAQKILQTAA